MTIQPPKFDEFFPAYHITPNYERQRLEFISAGKGGTLLGWFEFPQHVGPNDTITIPNIVVFSV